MTIDPRVMARCSGLLLGLCLLVATGCSDDDDGGGGSSGSSETTFSCGTGSKGCVEYKGSATNIDSIRSATKCTEQGGVEGTGCAKDNAATCTLPRNGSTGTAGAQYFYDVDEDDLPSLQTICSGIGGTFTPP